MKTLLRLALGISSFTLLTGCYDLIDHNTIRQNGFVYCGQNNPDTFNPQQVDSGITSEVLSAQIYDTLLQLDPETHLPTPNIAVRWSVNEKGTEYTFTLKKEVQFQTTEWFTPTRPLEARDVVFSFKRIIDPEHPFHAIGGQYPWFSSINFQHLVLDVQEVNPYTVKFILKKPDNSFLSNIATRYAVILSEEYAQQLLNDDIKAISNDVLLSDEQELTHNIDESQQDEDALFYDQQQRNARKKLLDSKPVGTGPFYLDQYQMNDLIRLRRHNDYWKGPAKMSQVVFDVSHRGTGTLAKLLRHECDILSSPIASQIEIINQQDNLVIDTKPAMNSAFIAVNTSHPALKDIRVRKALNFAINRQNILDSVYYGTGTIAYTILPPSSWAYQKDNTQIRYNPNYAIGLLKEAGYSSNLELTMSVPLEPQIYNPSPKKTAELIQANLAKVGITLHLLTEDRMTRRDLIKKENIDLALTGWKGTTGDPDNFLRPLLSCNSSRSKLNVSMWCNDDFDLLLDLALETNSKRHRLNSYRQALNILNQEFPVIPLTHGLQFKAHSNTLTGLKFSPFSALPFDSVKREQ